MIIKTYKCDSCGEECKDKDVTIIANFPRRKYEYARSANNIKLMGFQNIIFEETHFCPQCLRQLLNLTAVIDEE